MDAPTQVRIRTDPDEDLEYRYRRIVRAKEALGTGNNTETIVAACDHAVRDVEAKRDALELLADEVGDDLLEEIAESLSTPHVDIDIDRELQIGID